MKSDFDVIGHGLDPAEALRQLKAQPEPPALHHHKTSARTYQPDDELRTAINLAVAVRAPLLLTGEPGTGKTDAAWWIGAQLGVETRTFHVKSTSTAEALKYEFDAVGYLRAANEPVRADVKRPERRDFYIKGPLWLAYADPEPSVLLIDEIDKAQRDFPNDLLNELDQHCFPDPIDKTEIRPRARAPIVVITSNAERRLPDAFLRRCIFHHIELDEGLVRRAVEARAKLLVSLPDPQREEAVRVFWRIRRLDLQKPPALGELLTWLAILDGRGALPEDLSTWPPTRAQCARWGLGALVKHAEDYEKLCG